MSQQAAVFKLKNATKRGDAGVWSTLLVLERDTILRLASSVRDMPAGAGFVCSKATVPRDAIKETFSVHRILCLA